MKALDQKYAKDYMLAGRAMVTFHNTLTGNQFTYLIKAKKDSDNTWFVTHHNLKKTFLGSIYTGNNPEGNFSSGIDVPNEVVLGNPMRVFGWMWDKIQKQAVPDYIEILRSDTCGHCGRSLTEALSLTIGIGPECRKKLDIDESKFK